MTRISSLYTRPARWVFILVVSGLVLGFALRLAAPGHDAPKAPAILALAFLSIVGALLYWNLFHGLADDVHDHGDHLVFLGRGREERVEMSDILEVTVTFSRPRRVTLKVRDDSRAYREVAFVPADPPTLRPFQDRSPVADDLEARARQARIDAGKEGPAP